jgi:hypothetical protein
MGMGRGWEGIVETEDEGMEKERDGGGVNER